MAVDPFDAMEKIKQLNPDVVTLDVEMPKLNGIDFLKKIDACPPASGRCCQFSTGQRTRRAGSGRG